MNFSVLIVSKDGSKEKMLQETTFHVLKNNKKSISHSNVKKKNEKKICKSVQYFQTYFLVFTFFTWTSVTSDFILFFKSWFFQVLKFPAMMVMMMMMMNYFCGMVEWKIVCSLFPAGTVVRDSHHHKSLICCKQDLNLSRTWVQALMNEVVQ